MFEICRIWLLALGAVMAVAGTSMVFLAGLKPFEPVLRLLDRAFWPAGPDDSTRNFEIWTYSVTFATMAGWGICVASIAANAFATKQLWAWWTIAGSLLVWYPLDTGRSMYHRVWLNAAVNTLLFVLAAIPLALTLSEFR